VGAAEDETSGGETSTTKVRERHVSTVLVLVVVLAITAALTLGARTVHGSNEKRLLDQKAQEVGAVLRAALPAVQTPLASVAEVAEATDANPKHISRLLAPLVGPRPAHQFVSAAIWSVTSHDLQKPLVVIGKRPTLASESPREIRAVLQRASKTPLLDVRLLDTSPPRLAYAYASSTRPVRFVVYAESEVPATGQAKVSQDSAFGGLEYALYLGKKADPQALITAGTTDLPLRGRTASVAEPFGDTYIDLVMAPTSELGGNLLARLPWLLLGSGILLALIAAGLTERLVRQRERARRLAAENASLYAAQRTVAQTLQHSLLPDRLPQLPQLTVGARYIAGVTDIDIGGDWYDVIDVGGGRVFFAVGDVSGRGLPAATIMASLRYAIRAYVAQGDEPATVLTKLNGLLNVGADGHFATVLCGVIDVGGHTVTIANAAHPEPLLIEGDRADYVPTTIGVPIGVRGAPPYTAVTVTASPAATLLAFTDGLVERRDDILDAGLERVRTTAARPHASLEGLLTDLADGVSSEGPADDIAILGVRWTN
jgi:serine phosphatase RsbU (regulator of sigma subunit)